jgi:hypothetical protein
MRNSSSLHPSSAVWHFIMRLNFVFCENNDGNLDQCFIQHKECLDLTSNTMLLIRRERPKPQNEPLSPYRCWFPRLLLMTLALLEPLSSEISFSSFERFEMCGKVNNAYKFHQLSNCLSVCICLLCGSE